MGDTTEQITLTLRSVETRGGHLTLIAEEKSFDSQRPVALILHGALRDASALFHWVRLLDTHFDVVFVDLPGHGSSPSIEEVSVESFAANIGDAVRGTLAGREIVIIGESISGLIAIAMGDGSIAEIRAVVGVDPPFAMRKLYATAQAMMRVIAEAPGVAFVADFALNFFGVHPDGVLEERLYYDLIGALRVPSLILTGDFLMPPVPVATQNMPCLMDLVDKYVIEHLFPDRTEIRVIPNCGHVLLVEAVGPTKEHILSFCAPLVETTSASLAKAG